MYDRKRRYATAMHAKYSNPEGGGLLVGALTSRASPRRATCDRGLTTLVAGEEESELTAPALGKRKEQRKKPGLWPKRNRFRALQRLPNQRQLLESRLAQPPIYGQTPSEWGRMRGWL
jgi:hypothetical protein